MKILIIEDNPTNLKLATSILVHLGYDILIAEEANTGINLAQKEQPHLILMDIQLPGMNGLDATKILKEKHETAHIVIIAFTASAMKGDKEKFLAAGCDDYISKPICYKKFVAKIEKWTSAKNS